MLEDVLGLRGLVLEHDLDALVQITGHLETIPDDGGIEFDFRKDRGIGMEVHRRAGSARRAESLERPDRLPLFEPHLPRCAIAFDRRDQLLRQGVDHAGTDAVEAAGGFVVARFELAARVQHCEDHLEGALLRGRMLVDGDAASVVFDGDR